MSIDALDKALIVAWHEGWHPAALDAVAPWWRDRDTWLAPYALLVGWLVWRFRKTGAYLALAAAATVAVADTVAAGVLKKVFARLRPCNVPEVAERLDLLTGCGPGLSFPSAHATNHFALAAFLGLTCFAARPLPRVLAYAWAASIALAQVYVGRHYPSDVAAGTLLGIGLGWGSARLFGRFFALQPAAA